MCFKGPSNHGQYNVVGVVSSIFEKWHKYYASVDGESLRFYESKSSTEAVSSINATDIHDYVVELTGIDRLAAKQSKLAFVEDIYTFILITASRDEILIKSVNMSLLIFCDLIYSMLGFLKPQFESNGNLFSTILW